ncbi:exonuclease sbcCD subunit D [Pueribacillus theae]|uniref:Nuclease SbcCD subunit D n=1 Tax=Pueribacillus theae TaxID=2171751 RepID=A0A2U1K6G7_9BACI|nr:exonuclease SbcCD subunit D [Pueribacillus theae]PWA12845.1 exonuclease sbcCD subunit D [Pueribacillus theae]
MRILHTADWHFGKTLEGRSRHAEQEQFIDELCEIAQSENIDVILIAGDVYDTVNPPAASEQLFYDSLARLADYGKRKVIVIAGNHDNPERLAAATPIAIKHGITLIGTPIMQAVTAYVEKTGEVLKVAALPYPSESRLKELLTESQAEEVLQQVYQERVGHLFNKLCSGFSNDSVNILTSHLFVAGGRESDSERPIQVGGAYTIHPSFFPETAQYVALGHLHRPQYIRSAKTTARYAGSPLAYSFSEAGQAKSVTIIEVKPGAAALVEEVFLNSGKSLVEWKASSIPEIYKWLDERRDHNCWVNVEIASDGMIAMEDIQSIRKAHDGIVHIRPIYRTSREEMDEPHFSTLPIDELFTRFYERQTGGAKPEEELVKLFFELIADDDD